MQTPASLTAQVSTRPTGLQLLGAGALVTLIASFVMWWADASFYSRFQVMVTEFPGWSPWSMLKLANQFLGWLVAAALWLAWSRRHLVVVGAVILLGMSGLVAHTWAEHEAGRVWAGTPVWPNSLLPFDFSARAVTMVPVSSTTVGLPSRVLLLRADRSSSIVYDPATRRTLWVGNGIATWTISDGGKSWPR